MSLKGQFDQIISQRVRGMRIYSFTLTNSAWLGSETFEAILWDDYSNQSWHYRNLSLKRKRMMINRMIND